MQVLNQEGINYFYVDVRELNGYMYPDSLVIKLSKEGCKSFYFETTLNICYNSLEIKFDINQCLDKTGVYKIEILNAAKETIYQNFIQISTTNAR